MPQVLPKCHLNRPQSCLKCQKRPPSDPKLATKSPSYTKSEPKVTPKSPSHAKSDHLVTPKLPQSHHHMPTMIPKSNKSFKSSFTFFSIIRKSGSLDARKPRSLEAFEASRCLGGNREAKSICLKPPICRAGLVLRF